MAKSVALACYGSTLGSNPDISQKYAMCDISKGVANTTHSLARQKNIQKQILFSAPYYAFLIVASMGKIGIYKYVKCNKRKKNDTFKGKQRDYVYKANFQLLFVEVEENRGGGGGGLKTPGKGEAKVKINKQTY